MILEDTIKIKKFFEKAITKVEIDEKRTAILKLIAKTVREVSKNSDIATHLNFICTHNSRRSQFAQVWAYYAANYFNLPNIQAYSGGTATTSFHKNTVKTLQKTGFLFNVLEFKHQNPKYAVRFDAKQTPLLAFSKLYDDPINTEPFIAITTCSSADENCPFIPSALFRFHLPFQDPKEFDNTDMEEKSYEAANLQIAAEIFVLFQEINKRS